MAIAYQYDASGYFAGEVEDYGLLPNNATATAPTVKEGHIPKWTGKKWQSVQNHKGKEGFLNGEPFTITEYGPLPAGFSETPPEPTLEEAKAAARSALRAKRTSVEYGGFMVDGQLWGSKEKDETRLQSVAAVFAAGVQALEGWKISDGVYITLTPELCAKASLAMMEHYGKAYAVEKAKLQAIEDMDTVGALQSWQETELDQGW